MITPESRRALTSLALQSIEYGVEHRCVMPVDLEGRPQELLVVRSSFVTLHKQDQLRGCIGSLEAKIPLIEDVVFHAYGSAFKDPRFPPVNAEEVASLDIHLSVLSPAEPIEFSDEENLLRQLRPGVDGLVLKAEGRQGTFLPSVWDTLPEPRAFFRQLKRKAGLEEDYWSDSVTVERYTTESW